MESKLSPDPREYLANERTFMAWLRTGIATMAFGFVVVKFSLFWAQLSLMAQQAHGLAYQKYAIFTGLAILLMGGVVIPLAFFQYKRVNRQLEQGHFTTGSILPALMAALLTLVAISLLVYLAAITLWPYRCPNCAS